MPVGLTAMNQEIMKTMQNKLNKLMIYCRRLCALACLLAFGRMAAADLTFEGVDAARAPIAVDVAASTGLEKVYVVSYAGSATAVFTPDVPSQVAEVRWQRFSNLGGGFAEDMVSFVQDGKSKITMNSADMGYIVSAGGRNYCFWVVNYMNHPCSMQSLDVVPGQQECDRTALQFGGTADRIQFFSVNGVGQTLSRELHLTYNTLVFDQESFSYVSSVADNVLEYASDVIRTEAPLCDTGFTLSGDRFLTQWGEGVQIESPSFTATAVGVVTSAQPAGRDIDNEQKDNTSALGGSGPVEVTFTAATSDAVVYREWQFARDREFDLIDLRIQENEVTHVFSDYGTTYVRFVAGNNDNSCDYTGETYEVYVGESHLDCPNAFSPGASEGVNDEWKVSYKSIIDFDCHIFNRWGLEMAHLTHPSQGWDGRYKGKLVPSGVYYYVITATGTDGQEYKLAGDINILNYKNNNTTIQPQQ